MDKYSKNLVQQARRLAATDGLGYGEIASRLDINVHIIKEWCQDLVFGTKSAKTIRTNELRRRALLASGTKDISRLSWGHEFTINYCAILYGCEGSKYPATKMVSFINSDPLLVRSFVVLLRKSFEINENKLKVHLLIHKEQKFEELKEYWSDLLNISKNQFYKPTITTSSGKKHRNQYFGTCSVRYSDQTVQLRLLGIFSEFLRKSVE